MGCGTPVKSDLVQGMSDRARVPYTALTENAAHGITRCHGVSARGARTPDAAPGDGVGARCSGGTGCAVSGPGGARGAGLAGRPSGADAQPERPGRPTLALERSEGPRRA